MKTVVSIITIMVFIVATMLLIATLQSTARRVVSKFKFESSLH